MKRLGRSVVVLVGLGALLPLGVSGCQSEPPLVPVVGKLTVQGKILAHARIQFIPDAEKGNKFELEGRARVDEAGTYTLMVGDKPGCPPGWYKVVIYAMQEPLPGEGPIPPRWLASRVYTMEKSTPLSVEVTANPPTGHYDFDLIP